MREKGQTEVAKTLEIPVFSRGIEILTEKTEFTQDILCYQLLMLIISILINRGIFLYSLDFLLK